jgi:hypothetical protein
MSTQERVIVVLLKGTDKVLTCEDSWDDYDIWLEESNYSRDEITRSDCRVHSR